MKNVENTELDRQSTHINYADPYKTKYGSKSALTTQDLRQLQSERCDVSKYSLKLLSEIWPALKKDILSRTNSPRYPIGLNSLDSVLWGLHKREMMAIGARTSQGKTAFTLYLAKQMAERSEKVIYFSLEMSREQILERLLTQVVRINNLALRHGEAKDNVLREESMFKAWIDNAKMLIDDKYGYDFNNIIDICHAVRPGFVFIDYIQMISVAGYRNKLEAIEEYVRKLKELSNDLNFGVVVVSQINRQGVDGAEMHHMKHAGVLEEHPDSVLTLNWDWSEVDQNKYLVSVKKQRHGPTKNNIEFTFLPQYSIFEERKTEAMF